MKINPFLFFGSLEGLDISLAAMNTGAFQTKPRTIFVFSNQIATRLGGRLITSVNSLIERNAKRHHIFSIVRCTY